MDRVGELAAELGVGLVWAPHLQLLERRHGADLLDDLGLRRLPQRLLLGRVGLAARRRDLGLRRPCECVSWSLPSASWTIDAEWKNCVR